MKKYEILLFDLDGTLIDFSVDQKFAFKEALEKIGYEYTDDILEQYKEINRIVWNKLEKGEIKTVADLFEERCKMFFEIYNINESTCKFNNLLDEGMQKSGTTFKETKEILEKLSKMYKLAIITNGPKSQQYSRLENAKISEYFSYVFVSEEIGYNKPNIKFFEYMFEKIEEKDKTKMLVIGDSLTSDIQGGINAGIDTCWCNWKKKENKTTIKPNYEINKLEELLSMLV